MRRRDLLRVPLLPWLHLAAWQDAGSPEPVPETHFPSRLYQFIWRNWELATTDRMAKMLRTTPDKILEIGLSMGLPEKRTLAPNQLRRLYVTVIRQNWHLLPEKQIIELLGWTEDKYQFTLKEDDFLDVKLGPKPRSSQLLYATPTADERARAAQIRTIIEETFGPSIHERGEDLLQFIQELGDQRPRALRNPSAKRGAGEIEFTEGWTIIEPSSVVLASAARRFKQYLQDAMGVDIAISSEAGVTDKRMRLAVLDGAAQPESFEIHATDSEIAVTGGGDAGVLQGLYWLQDAIDQREAPLLPQGTFRQRAVWNPRYLYSYFALYGDPLIQADTELFPDGYLEKLARTGINGVWLQTVLNTLAPSRQFPEFGAGWETRLKNLAALVARAKRFGVRVYLYLNEPRAMADDFFQRHPEVRGSSNLGLHAMCTSVPSVRDWIAESLAHIVRAVPDLGGFFSITMSENHTNCFSHGGEWEEKAPNAGDCPRCSGRKSWEVIAELIQTFRDGVRRVGSATEVIVWDWGWGDELAAELIPQLPRDVALLSVSEWDLPLRRGGISTKVGEYSISAVGPGPRAARNWERARNAGIRTLAKTQFNNTWEISAVPYIPVTHLILRHCENLSTSGVSGIMPSWTCGGYASPNLAAAKAYYFEPRKSMDEILVDVANQRYGRAAAPSLIEAWRRFSVAFAEFPYGVSIYVIPVQHGPANPLRLAPTRYRPGMILFPYDDYQAWSGEYPPGTVHKQFSKMAALWKEGLIPLREGLVKVPKGKRKAAELDLAIAETCCNHFQSVANQVDFYMLRDKLAQESSSARTEILKGMRAIAAQEIELAQRQFLLARRNSTIGFEASNHYYFTPLDLVEKVLNCRDIIARLA